MLLKFLGEVGEGGLGILGGAVAVSVPFDLAASAAALERGMGRIYARYFGKADAESRLEGRASGYPLRHGPRRQGH